MFVQADCLGRQHHGDLRRQGIEPGDPMLGWVCKEVEVPGHAVGDSLRTAALFAAEAPEGETMVLVAETTRATGRLPVVDSFDGTFAGLPTKIVYLCGFTATQEGRMYRCEFCGGRVAKTLRMEGNGVTERVLCNRCARDMKIALKEV